MGTASHATVLTPAPERSQRSVLIEELKPKDVVLLKTGSSKTGSGRHGRSDRHVVATTEVSGGGRWRVGELR